MKLRPFLIGKSKSKEIGPSSFAVWYQSRFSWRRSGKQRGKHEKKMGHKGSVKEKKLWAELFIC